MRGKRSVFMCHVSLCQTMSRILPLPHTAEFVSVLVVLFPKALPWADMFRALCFASSSSQRTSFPLRYSLRIANFVSALTFQPLRGTICCEKGCRPFHGQTPSVHRTNGICTWYEYRLISINRVDEPPHVR